MSLTTSITRIGKIWVSLPQLMRAMNSPMVYTDYDGCSECRPLSFLRRTSLALFGR